MEEQEKIQEILSYYNTLEDKARQENVVSMLRELQEICGYLTPEMKAAAAETAGVKLSFLQGIIGRFSTLKDAPYRHEITLCSGARCGNKGGQAIITAVEKTLGMKGPGISPDGKICLKIRNCLKQCRTSPNFIIDGTLYPQVQAEEIPKILKSLD